ADLVKFGETYAAAWGSGGWLALADRPGVIPGTPFLPGEINPMDEKTQAAYAMAKYDHRFDNGIDISGNFGVRYVHTDRDSSGGTVYGKLNGLTTAAQCAAMVPPLSAFCSLTPAAQDAARAWSDGVSVPNTAKLSYDFVLPSWNMKVDL